MDFFINGPAGRVPDTLCSVCVKDQTHPWGHVPQVEQDAAGLYWLVKSIDSIPRTHLQNWDMDLLSG
jgi:hypothetical protein